MAQDPAAEAASHMLKVWSTSKWQQRLEFPVQQVQQALPVHKDPRVIQDLKDRKDLKDLRVLRVHLAIQALQDHKGLRVQLAIRALQVQLELTDLKMRP